MGDVNGLYPVPGDVSQSGQGQPMADAPVTAATSTQSSADPDEVKLRRHSACDECRKRKLKCSGEPTGCSRCVKIDIPCVYSQQKQMGRPRKRQKTDEGSRSPAATDEVRYAQLPSLPAPSQSEVEPQSLSQLGTPPIDPSLANIDNDLTNFQNVCPGPMAQTIRGQRNADTFRKQSAPDGLNMFEQPGDDAVHPDFLYARYPTDISMWPDFSTIDRLPLPLTTRFDVDPANDNHWPTSLAPSISGTDMSQTYSDPDVDPSALAALPAIPACPCLPNLYLSLSTLSTLTSFPISQHTIDTLLSAHKTAHGVIYCPICPQQYQSGSQNLMLGCTLLNVIADHWHRIRNTSSEALRKGFSVNSSQHQFQHIPNTGSNGAGSGTGTMPFITVKEGQTWRTFAKQLIRAYVFGDAPIPHPPPPPGSSSTTPPPPSHTPSSAPTTSPNNSPTRTLPPSQTLTFLVSALIRRQRQWHRLDPATDEFPDRLSTYEYPGHPRSHQHHNSHKTIIEAAGKIHDPDIPRSPSPNDNNSHGDSNGTGAGKTNENKRKQKQEDTLLCLMIVQQSKDILEALDRD